MQIELSRENLNLFIELKKEYRKKVPSYDASTTQLANQMLNEMLKKLIEVERKTK